MSYREDLFDDDDLYDGFGDDDAGAPGGAAFGAARGPFGGAPPTTSLGRGPPGTQMGSRLMTSQQQSSGDARPMTSVNGAGYTSHGRGDNASRQGFDPLNQGNRGPAPALAEKTDSSPEERAKEIEKQVNRLLEASAEAAAAKQFMAALEKAKEAAKKERYLCRNREQNGLAEQINMELTYAVSFNLANTYVLNGMLTDALNTYSTIVKNKQYPQAGRLRVNMGNIYFSQKDYLKAVRMYRMALDQIPNTGKEVRFRIMRNIGNAFVRMGQFQEAIENFEAIMTGNPDYQSGFNLVVCQYALGDAEQMKRAFSRLLDIPVPGKSEEEEDDEEDNDADRHDENNEAKMNENPGGSGLGLGLGLGGGQAGMGEIHPDEKTPGSDEGDGPGKTKPGLVDMLKEELREREKQARTFVTNAAKLIAPAIDPKDWVAGYDWVIEALRSTQFASIASEMEIVKAIGFLKRKQFDKAIEVLKAFEKKDQHLKARAATNLSFLYFLEGDLPASNKYANLAVRHDRYNAKALVNKGNCLFAKGELERARELYLEAIGVEADCSEAIYNLGLVNKRMGHLEEALQAFEKLHTIIPNSPEVIYQIANLNDLLLNFRTATKWFNILITRVPTDPNVLSRMGQIFNKDDDENQALHFHHESYRYYPVNLDVISWLGVWYVKNELYEKAIEFFQRASQIQPTEVKWRLMVTSCYRRMNAFQKALELYEQIHKEYPENVECLRYLVALCKDMGLPYDQYQGKLGALERSVLPTAARMGGGGGGGGQLTRAAAPSGAADQGQSAARRPKPASASAVGMNSIGEDRFEEEGKEIAAAERRINHTVGERGPAISKTAQDEEEDEWAEADLDELLAE